MFFGGGGQGGHSHHQQKRKCKARLVQMKITLEEAYKGGKKPFEYAKRITCKKCVGTGAGNPAANHKCQSCQGKGVKVVLQRMGHMVLQTQQTCGECQGEGMSIKDKCTDCKGEKVTYTTKTIDVDLDKGIPDGFRYSFFGDGDEYPEIDTGDLYVEVFLEKHKDFIRKGADLVYKMQISLLEALTGVSFDITHLDGRTIKIKTKDEEMIKPGVYKTIRDLGMPFHNSPYKFGNLYIDFEIVFPEKLNEVETKQISEILNFEKLNKLKVNSDEEKDTENYFISDYVADEENTHHSGGKGNMRSDDEDEEESHGHGHGQGGHPMNCAHQ